MLTVLYNNIFRVWIKLNFETVKTFIPSRITWQSNFYATP